MSKQKHKRQNIIIWTILGVVVIIGLFLLSSVAGTGAKIAVVPIQGVILTASDGFGGVTSSAFVVEELKSISEDPSVYAVILEINSPGGSGVASDEIARAVRTLDKPVVAVIRESGASGAYWIASSTDRIYASRLSTVGSIGVIGSYLEFSGLMDDYNVSYQRFVAGKHKDFGSPFREPTEEEADRYQEILDGLHTLFIEEVARGRNMSVEDVRSLADGFIYTGIQAREEGLIDEFGTVSDAEEALEEVFGQELELVWHEQPQSLFGLFGYTIPQVPGLAIYT
jgi:protease-4